MDAHGGSALPGLDLESEAAIAFAHELADAARMIARRYFRRRLSVQSKADASPVTVADREIERTLRALIAERFPGHGIVGEEEVPRPGREPATWVIDPIDGTRSFITGVPLFGTLIALLAGAEPLLGVLEVPALGERWAGARGRPSEHGRRPCRASACESLGGATLFATSPYMFGEAERVRFERLASTVRMTRFGADCYAYGLLAAGWVDLVVEADMKPHDFLALAPIVTGAGGVMSDWRGRALGLDSGGQICAAATPALHAAALACLAR